MNNIDNEIKTIIALSGNRRLPELETEIFSDEELTTFYLTALRGNTSITPTNGNIAFWYANKILKSRWHEAEDIIMKNPRYACWYAEDVIRGRWKEAEQYIIVDARWIHYYCTNVTQERWLKAEKIVKKDKELWHYYKEFFEI